MSNVLDAIPPEHRAVIVEELSCLNPDLLDELRRAKKPTDDQSNAVVRQLALEVMKSLQPDYAPSEHGKAIDNAIGAYLLAWPVCR